MRRGLWMGITWFGSVVSIGAFFWIWLDQGEFDHAIFSAIVLYLCLVWFPRGYASFKLGGALAVDDEASHGPWSEREAAFLVFGGLVGATATIIGIVGKWWVLGGAAALGSFGLLGLLPACWLRRRRLAKIGETDESFTYHE